MSADIRIGSAFFNSIFNEYHKQTDEALASRESETLPLVLAQHLQTGKRRLPSEIKISVFTANQAEHGWDGRDSILHIVMPDMPFIVDSVVAAVENKTRGVLQVLHPILSVERNADGEIVDLSSDAAVSESWVEIVFRRLLLPEDAATLAAEIHQLLQKVVFVNSAWQPIRKKLLEAQLNPELAEFRDWLLADNFTFMALATFAPKNRELDNLTSIGLAELGISTVELHNHAGLHVMKSAVKAEVHRNVQIDEIHFVSEDSNSPSFVVFGLFGLNAYASVVMNIPVIGQKLPAVVDELQIRPNSHSYKDLLQILNSLPRDVYFSANQDWLLRLSRTLLNRSKQQDTWVFAQRSKNGHFADVVVYLPRDIVSTRLRMHIQEEIAKKYSALEVTSNVRLDENPTAVMHFQVRLGAASNLVGESDLLEVIRPIAIDWEREFAEYVVDQLGDNLAAHHLLQTYGKSFELNYQNDHSVELGFEDVRKIMSGEQMHLEIRKILGEHNYSIRLFHPDEPLALTKLLPVLEAFGLPISAEFPYIFAGPGVRTWWLQELEFNLGRELTESAIGELITAIKLVIDGGFESDRLFSLVTHQNLDLKSALSLMLLRNYVAQWLSTSTQTIESALLTHSAISARCAELFEQRLRFGNIANELIDEVTAAIDAIPNLEQDRIFRALLETINAAVRTNLYQDLDLQKQAISIKFKSASISAMPAPKPFSEVWVESARVRGIHIRFGAVARGGLRWSDRLDDLRTEIMGLVRAQIVKNSVIVPTGAKGGFFPKLITPELERSVAFDIAVSAYKEFIEALLDLADNLVAGQTVLADVVSLDSADPYLVVAADKGTATFSDYANKISTRRGFWLGDAFASGGSNGYDHKGMGITARGAFESVKHHFNLLGIDPTQDGITVIGIGDMSGDVFGNGMLLSRTIKLVAAFDHRHIFLDPNPDPAKTFEERLRLFNLARSSWADFNLELLSPGGGIFERSAKTIPLSNEIKKLTGLTADVVTPVELISALLKAPVDLLWNGGIGTYVKSNKESHSQVGDKANDAIRIDANQLRARVVGEGGNLGFTSAGRVEAALQGVAINTDAIDNSAGVDTSDHEVNLKILLSHMDDVESRNQILHSLTSEVAELVLADNIAQNAVLTQAAFRSEGMAAVHARMLADWAEAGLIDLELERMPSPADLLVRAESGVGLTKPELSVMLAHLKIQLKDAILESDIPAQAWAEKFLFSYFPQQLQNEFTSEILGHPLRAEIISTVIANYLVNRVGITAIWRVAEETNAQVLDIVRAYLFGFEITDLERIHERVDLVSWQDKEGRIQVTKEIRRFQDRVARWLLSNRAAGTDLFLEIDELKSAFAKVRPAISKQLKGDEFERWQKQTQSYKDLGIAEDLAELVAGLLDEYVALDLYDLKMPIAIDESSHRYFEVSHRLAGDRILNLISAMPRNDVWQTKARAALRADMYSILAGVTASSLRTHASFSEWQFQHETEIARIESLVAEIEELGAVDISALSVVLRNLRNFVNQLLNIESSSTS